MLGRLKLLLALGMGAQFAASQLTGNSPPTIWLERAWKIPADRQISSLVERVKYNDADNDPVTFGLRASVHQDGSHLFHINNTTGVIYLAANLSDKVDKQYYFDVTATDGKILVSTQILVEVVPPTGHPPL